MIELIFAYMNHGAISADIIASTSLDINQKEELIKEIKQLIKLLDKNFRVFGRVVKGDQIECYVPDPRQTLRVALILKYFIKSKTAISILSEKTKRRQIESRNKHFRIHGVRMAIAIDEMIKVDRKKGILDGQAIYLAGRAINEYHTFNKERIVIKNTIYFVSKNDNWKEEFDVSLSLIDILISKSTARQSEMMVQKLFSKRDELIAYDLKISQSAVNQNVNAAGWSGIEKALNRFENVIF